MSRGIGIESCQSPVLDIDILNNGSFDTLVGEPRIDFGEISDHDRFETHNVVRTGCSTLSLLDDTFRRIPLTSQHGSFGRSFGKSCCRRVLGEMTELGVNRDIQTRVIFRQFGRTFLAHK